MRRLRLDQVWLLVSPRQPAEAGRRHGRRWRSGWRRRSAVADGRRVVATGGGGVGSARATRSTRCALLRRRFPRARFVWLMGADNPGAIAQPLERLVAGVRPAASRFAVLPAAHLQWRGLGAARAGASIAPCAPGCRPGPRHVLAIFARLPPPAWIFLTCPAARGLPPRPSGDRPSSEISGHRASARPDRSKPICQEPPGPPAGDPPAGPGACRRASSRAPPGCGQAGRPGRPGTARHATQEGRRRRPPPGPPRRRGRGARPSRRSRRELDRLQTVIVGSLEDDKAEEVVDPRPGRPRLVLPTAW